MAMIAVTDRYARVSKADDESKNLVSLLWFGIITEWQCFERGRPVEPWSEEAVVQRWSPPLNSAEPEQLPGLARPASCRIMQGRATF